MSSLLARAPRALLALAAGLAALASLAILFTATGTQVSVQDGVLSVRQPSWFETQGWWGIAILLIFAGLYAAPAVLYRRGWRGAAVLSAAAAIVLTILASMSIGLFYYPAGLATLLALLSMPVDTR